MPKGLHYDALDAAVHRMAQCRAVSAAVHRHDFDFRHLVGANLDVLATHRRVRKYHPVRVDLAQEAEIARVEGLYIARVRLGDIARRVDLVVHGQHHALGLGLLAHRDACGIEQVAQAVKIRLGGIALGANQHHRLD